MFLWFNQVQSCPTQKNPKKWTKIARVNCDFLWPFYITNILIAGGGSRGHFIAVLSLELPQKWLSSQYKKKSRAALIALDVIILRKGERAVAFNPICMLIAHGRYEGGGKGGRVHIDHLGTVASCHRFEHYIAPIGLIEKFCTWGGRGRGEHFHLPPSKIFCKLQYAFIRKIYHFILSKSWQKFL